MLKWCGAQQSIAAVGMQTPMSEPGGVSWSRAGLTVLHLNKEFELIARITGQPTERLHA
jgi:hypothetical protein